VGVSLTGSRTVLSPKSDQLGQGRDHPDREPAAPIVPDEIDRVTQTLELTRLFSPRPRTAQQPALDLIRDAWGMCGQPENRPGQSPSAADKVHQARHLRVADVVRRLASGANGHDPNAPMPRTE
jgi:hypothetical protein